MNARKTVRRILLPMILALFLTVPVRAECDHEYEARRQEPTCEISGYTWLECIKCGDVTNIVHMDPTGHEFGAWYILTEPTCSKEGVQARDCVVCGFREEAPVPHLGHEYVVEVVEPTCTARGYTSHYCPGCGTATGRTTPTLWVTATMRASSQKSLPSPPWDASPTPASAAGIPTRR